MNFRVANVKYACTHQNEGTNCFPSFLEYARLVLYTTEKRSVFNLHRLSDHLRFYYILGSCCIPSHTHTHTPSRVLGDFPPHPFPLHIASSVPAGAMQSKQTRHEIEDDDATLRHRPPKRVPCSAGRTDGEGGGPVERETRRAKSWRQSAWRSSSSSTPPPRRP